MRENTQTIIDRINALSESIYNGMYTDREISRAIENAKNDRNKLKTMLVDVVMNSPTLRDYIENYMFINSSLGADKDRDYRSVSTNAYNKLIRKAFKANGFLPSVFVDTEDDEESISNEIERVIKCLNKPATTVGRTILFEVAFGLNMEIETLETLLKKALLQQGINAKNYKEVIYWWCLKNEFQDFNNPMDKCKKAKDLLEIYNNEKKLEELSGAWIATKKIEITDDVRTKLLLDELKNIKEEGNLYNYLYTLKQAKLEAMKSVSVTKEFEELLEEMPRVEEGYINNRLRRYLMEILNGISEEELNEIMSLIGSESGKIIDLRPGVCENTKSIKKIKDKGIELSKEQLERIQQYVRKEEMDYSGHKIIEDIDDFVMFFGSELSRFGKFDRKLMRVKGGYAVKERAAGNIAKHKAIAKEKVEKSLYAGELLPKKVVERLFDGIVLTEKGLRNRLSVDTNISANRKEMLFLYFLINVVGLPDEEEADRECDKQKNEADKNEKTYRNKNVDDFMDEASAFLNNLDMQPIYQKSPFDLFLILCLMYDEPFDYIMASFSLLD